jgi:tetratricopeptide (TPR) repeat protein
LWYDRLEDCRLETIELERLGISREGQDIAGDQIPRAYFRYVHDGDARDMDRIVYHNAMDVLTMTALAIHMDESLKEKDPARTNLFSVGRYYEKQGIQGMGTEFFEAASRQGPSHREKDRALFHLARQHRRDGRFEEAVCIWKGLVEREGYGFLDCCVEIAKHLEHRSREYDEAIGLVLHALERVEPEGGRVRADLEKRLSRLKRKKGTA